MKRAGFLLFFSSLLVCCGKSLDQQARSLVRDLSNASLSSSDVEVLEVRQTGDLAIAEVKVRTALKMRKKDSEWVLEEIRIGDRRWEKAQHILQAIEANRTETTLKDLETLRSGVDAYREAHGTVPQVSSFEALVDLLSPRHLQRIVRLDAWSNAFSYEALSSDTFNLRSAGPDGVFGSGDDLIAEGH